ATGRPGTEDLLLAVQADAEAFHGRLKSATDLTGQAMRSAEHNDARETAAFYQAAAALRDVESGRRELARTEANDAIKLAANRDVQAMSGLALARAGDTPAADGIGSELNKAFPLDTLVQSYWLPTIHAAIALNRKDPSHALELLKDASSMELSTPTGTAVILCPVYLRGEAYLAL